MKLFTIKNEEYEKVENLCISAGIKIQLSNPYREVLRDSLEISLDTQLYETESGEKIDFDIASQFTEEFIDQMATKATDEEYTHYWDRVDDAMKALIKNKIEEFIELKRIKNLKFQEEKAPMKKVRITLDIEIPSDATKTDAREIESNVLDTVKDYLGLNLTDSGFSMS